MTLVAVKDNLELLYRAFDVPSLIIDCGNCADPHSIPNIKMEDLHNVYVINAEAIYRFRDALKRTPHWAEKLKINRIIITKINALFSYDDDTENNNVLEHCWEIMKSLSKQYDVFVGVSEEHKFFALRFCDTVV